MLKNKPLIYALIALVCAGIIFVLYYTYSPEENKTKKDTKKVQKKPNDWEQKFGHRNINPYGTFIFYQLLKQQNNKVRILKRNSQYKKLDTIVTKRKLYIYVGRNFNTNPKRIQKILDFVARGNDAFIAADVFPNAITELFENEYDVHRSNYKNVELNFADSTLRSPKNFNFRFIYKRKTRFRYWIDFEKKKNYYDEYVSTADSSIKSFEYNMVTYNSVFLAVPHGKGTLYLHTTPYTFTNIVMLHERGVQHAERVISCLPNEPIIFDSYMNSSSDSNSGGDDLGNPGKRQSPLQFILENRALRWAYYCLLFGLLFYIIFKGKRKQKIIPAKDTIENNSVAFADTVSKLYLQYGQHKYIVIQQEKNFVNYVRNKYYINLNKPDDDTLNRLALKSGIEQQKITDLFERFKKVKTTNYASQNDVIDIYAQIEYFYKNCK